MNPKKSSTNEGAQVIQEYRSLMRTISGKANQEEKKLKIHYI